MPNTLREITAIAAGTVFATSASAQVGVDPTVTLVAKSSSGGPGH
jgi:hypothetical protein